nr:hypothetical protein [uncultured Acetatifactor sp.]
MMRLFLMECGKTARGILYWLFVLVLFFAGVRPLDETVESELRQKDAPSSVFYTAADGVYARDSGGLTDREIQENMMAGAVARLLESYQKNAYEYYPFGYVKTKTLSEEGQRVILSYLEELTGMGEEAINGAAEESGEEEFRISGGGAYVLEPGQGSMEENGQYVIEPGDWKYTENSAEIAEAEFYEDDHVTGAFARYYCDSISLVVLGLPALVMVELMMKDKNRRMQALVYPRTVLGARLVCTRFAAAVCMVMLPVLIFPARSLVMLVRFCKETGIQPDVFAFVKYALSWILPTVMLVMAMGLFLTILTENYSGILFTGLLWLAGRPSIGKIAGGNYGLFDLVIRHNTLKGYGRMTENLPMLALNRAVISGMALLFVALAIIVYETRRKGVGIFENRKFFNGFKVKYTYKS